MKLWIEKEKDNTIPAAWSDSLIFTLFRDRYSTIFTSIHDIWYYADCREIEDIYEDILTIALAVFAIDKRINRKMFQDAWTRDLEVSIPVVQVDAWTKTSDLWNKTLAYLTGDRWNLTFRGTDVKYSRRENQNRKHNGIADCDSVCLFSGGLDSFCGAIKLMEDGRSPCLIGHNEYPKLRSIQAQICDSFLRNYPDQRVIFQSFTANSRAPRSLAGETFKATENTCRGRSLLFICAALTVASVIGDNIPVYIPENGFIGLNIPLTPSRKGSCSTRTTHPYFLRQLTEILRKVGIQNSINNFFAYNTKREIVDSVKGTRVFSECYKKTISCSHPCLPRYNKTGSREYPVNCGYCYPCIIRESSLLDVDDANGTEMSYYDFMMQNQGSDKTSDLRAVIYSLSRFKRCEKTEIENMIRKTGRLSAEEVAKFYHVYSSTMADIENLLCKDSRMKEYIGI